MALVGSFALLGQDSHWDWLTKEDAVVSHNEKGVREDVKEPQEDLIKYAFAQKLWIIERTRNGFGGKI